MKKIWLIFALVVILVAQLTFLSSFDSSFTHGYVSDTSAVVLSKMKYAHARFKIHILVNYKSSVTLTFPNGTQQEITDDYMMDVFLPRTGDFLGNDGLMTFITTTPNSPDDTSIESLPTIRLSSKHPVDADVVQHIPTDFLSWYNDPKYLYYDKIDVFWFKIQGQANIFITASGLAI